jgi:hypothetical protein
MTQFSGCLSGLFSRAPRMGTSALSKSREAIEVQSPEAKFAAMSRDTINLFAAMDAVRYQVVAQNADRIDQMLERFERTLRCGEPFPDGAFSERVIRPIMTWLKALTYLPDEGEFAKIGKVAEGLLEHIPLPESEQRRPLREFGSTERLEAHENVTEVTRGLVDWTIPLLHRFVAMLKCLATGERSPENCESLLEAIRRHQRMPDGYSGDVTETAPVAGPSGVRVRRGAQGSGSDDSGLESEFGVGLARGAGWKRSDDAGSKRQRIGTVKPDLPAAASGTHPAAEDPTRQASQEPVYASVRPRDAAARKRHQPEPRSPSREPVEPSEPPYIVPFDSVSRPRHGKPEASRPARALPAVPAPERRDVGTQTESPSWVSDMKRDPGWRTNPIWWESFEANHRMVRSKPARVVEKHDERAELKARAFRRHASVVDVRAAQAVVNGRRVRFDETAAAEARPREMLI